MNSTFEHAQGNTASKTICIFWTHTESEINARRANGGYWTPNHFVPLLFPSNYPESQNDLAQSRIAGSGSVRSRSKLKL